MYGKHSTPDRGYAYVILLASFLGHILQYGVVWTVGVFFAVFIEVFPNNNGTLALISSLNTAFYYGAGPLSSLLTNRYGPRQVSVVGGLLGSIGLVLSSLAHHVYVLYVTFGIITGFGLGLAYIPAVTTVGLYFDKYRSLAIGIAVSGCGIGTFLFPPLIRFFIQQYAWRGALLLLGAVTLNICFCGMLMRPFTSPLPVTEKDTEEAPSKLSINKLSALPKYVKKADRPGVVSRSTVSLYEQRDTDSSQKLLIATSPMSKSKPSLHTVSVAHLYSPSGKIHIHSSSGTVHLQSPNGSIQRADSNISLFLTTAKVREPAKSNDNMEKTSVQLFIFKNMNYLLLCFNNFGVCFGLSIVYVHLAAYASSNGIDKDKSAYLFSVIGIANFVGRIAFGAFGSIPCVNHIGLYSASFAVSGIATIVCPLEKSYIWFFTYAAVFGFSTGGFGALLPQVIIQILELKQLTSGYGYLLIFEAMGTLLGAPVGGWLYDWCGRYEVSLYVGGTVIVLSSLLQIYTWVTTTNSCCCGEKNKMAECDVTVTLEAKITATKEGNDH